MKKALKIALFSVLGLVVVAGVLVWMELGPPLQPYNTYLKMQPM
jgi:hypothetical protein